MNLWQSLYAQQALQHPTFKGVEDYGFDNFLHMYEKLEEARPGLDSSRFYELRYEDVVRDPIMQVRAIYEHLELGDFDPKLKRYMANTADYKTNRYELPPELRDTITQRWGHVIRRYGYACDSESRPKSGGAAHQSTQAVSPLGHPLQETGGKLPSHVTHRGASTVIGVCKYSYGYGGHGAAKP